MPLKSRAEIKLMTEEEKKEYQKQLNRERVYKYREANKDTPEYKQKHKEEVYKWRQTHQEQFKELNKRSKQAYNNKQKALKEQHTSINLIQNAIRMKIARKALEKALKEQEVITKINATKTANDMTDKLFEQVLTAIPEKKKAGRPRKHRNPVGRPRLVKP